MSYAAPAVITIKARHGRDAWRGPRVQAVQARGFGSFGQSDTAPLPSGMTIEPRPGEPGYGPTVTVRPPAFVPGAKTPAGAPVSTTPYVPTAIPVATQQSNDWMPWAIGGGIALLVLGGGALALSR